MAQNHQKNTWQKVRKLLNDLHLWMGIASGIVLFVVCLTGTIYTFSTEIQEMLEPAKFKVTAKKGMNPLPAESIIAKVLDSLKGMDLVSFTVPENKSRTWQVTLRKTEKANGGKEGKKQPGNKESNQNAGSPLIAGEIVATEKKNQDHPGNEDGAQGKTGEVSIEKNEKKNPATSELDKPGGKKEGNTGGSREGGGGGRGTTYLVDQYTGDIKGTTQGAGSDFFMVMFRLHRWLMLDTEIGRPIVGVATIIFTLLVCTGLVIWVPQRAKMWRQGLKMKLNGNWKRANHDLHNSLGFYAAVPLLVMSLTGLTWSFEWYKEGFQKMLGAYKSKDAPKEKPVQSIVPEIDLDKKLLIADYLAAASTVLSYKGDYRVTLPANESASVSVSKSKTGFFAPAASDRLQIDQYSGAILKKEIFKDKPLGERISASVKALHVGNVYGTFSKIIYFLACLIATSLPVTGTLIWINKLKKKNNNLSSPEIVI